jgi:hypothetical protein
MTSDWIWIENFRFTNGSGDGVDSASLANPDYWAWINCDFDNNGDDGWTCSTAGADHHRFIGCRFYSNTGDGVGYASPYGIYVNCAAYSNGSAGLRQQTAHMVIVRNIVFDNGDSNPNIRLANDALVDSSIADGTNQSSEDGIYAGNDRNFILATRITNAAEGVDANTQLGVVGWSLFQGNTDDTNNDTLLYHLPFESDLDLSGTDKGVFSEGNPTGTTNKFDPDADDGYTSASGQDYNLKASRTYNGDGSDTVGFNVGS